jgi:hypothetical protein
MDGWVARTEELHNDDGKVYPAHTNGAYLSTINFPKRHMSKWSKWKRAFGFILVFFLTYIHLQGVKWGKID